MDFIWRGSPTLGSKVEIFTEILGGANEYCDWFFQYVKTMQHNFGRFDFTSDPVSPTNVSTYGNNFINFAEVTPKYPTKLLILAPI